MTEMKQTAKGVGAKETQAHKMIMDERSKMQMTGVKDVISFDADEIILETEAGMLLIRGGELHMSRLSLETGEVHVEGVIDGLSYSDKGSRGKKSDRLLSRLFK